MTVAVQTPLPSETIIETAGVRKSFGGTAGDVLASVSVQVNSGEAVAIVGSNGAGKSTLLKCLVGLVPLSDGKIDIFGETFSREPSGGQKRRLRRNIGFVFQFHGLVGRLSVLSNVVHGAIGQGYGFRAWHHVVAPDKLRREAMMALERVSLADRALDRADTLSGGQSQRVAIARAIVHKPRLLIADEPVASLDPSAGEDVMQLFRDISGGDITLIYTTHNIEHALAYSDRIIAMRGGTVAFDRTTSRVNHETLEAVYRD
ncbi:MAG: ATP-binding cassette domain-containing protein [Pseudomonadota bacterium]